MQHEDVVYRKTVYSLRATKRPKHNFSLYLDSFFMTRLLVFMKEEPINNTYLKLLSNRDKQSVTILWKVQYIYLYEERWVNEYDGMIEESKESALRSIFVPFLQPNNTRTQGIRISNHARIKHMNSSLYTFLCTFVFSLENCTKWIIFVFFQRQLVWD